MELDACDEWLGYLKNGPGFLDFQFKCKDPSFAALNKIKAIKSIFTKKNLSQNIVRRLILISNATVFTCRIANENNLTRVARCLLYGICYPLTFREVHGILEVIFKEKG